MFVGSVHGLSGFVLVSVVRGGGRTVKSTRTKGVFFVVLKKSLFLWLCVVCVVLWCVLWMFVCVFVCVFVLLRCLLW